MFATPRILHYPDWFDDHRMDSLQDLARAAYHNGEFSIPSPPAYPPNTTATTRDVHTTFPGIRDILYMRTCCVLEILIASLVLSDPGTGLGFVGKCRSSEQRID